MNLVQEQNQMLVLQFQKMCFNSMQTSARTAQQYPWHQWIKRLQNKCVFIYIQICLTEMACLLFPNPIFLKTSAEREKKIHYLLFCSLFYLDFCASKFWSIQHCIASVNCIELVRAGQGKIMWAHFLLYVVLQLVSWTFSKRCNIRKHTFLQGAIL